MRKFALLAGLALTAAPQSPPDDFCGIRNTAFAAGERIDYKVFYNVIGIYVDAGDASFTVNRGRYNDRSVYHMVGKGSSNPRYDWIFKVRDTYESFIDTATLKPYRFRRDVSEGGFHFKEDVSFDQERRRAQTGKGVYTVPACVQDVLSAIYYARNIDFDRYRPGDKVPFSMFIDEAVHDLFIRYLGREVVKTRFGRFKAIKFRPLLINGTIFTGGERMTVWVSDDRNRIPLRIESPITVGSVKVDMKSSQNLRYPMTSRLAEE